MLQVGLMGCGTIGGEIGKAIDRGVVSAELSGIFDVDPGKAEALSRCLTRKVEIRSGQDLIRASDLVVEATHRDSAPDIIRECLLGSRDVMVLSVGGLLSRFEEFQRLAAERGRFIYVPSGAIAGLDAVKAASVGKISSVTLRTRKPPRGLEGAPYVREQGIDLKVIREPTLLFSGSAMNAVPAFPANINVAAALSLAGLGPEETRVEIIADPTCDRNVHQVEVEGVFGKLMTRTELVSAPHNPRTSLLAAFSAIALLRRITSHVMIGT